MIRKPVRLLYVDIDGTVRRPPEGKRYVHGPEDVVVYPEVPPLLARYRAEGWRVVGVSNQGGIALGHTTKARVAAAMALTNYRCDFAFEKIFTCRHHPEDPDPDRARCFCRKPGIGMLVRANIELGRRYHEFYPLHLALMVGDMPVDEECARNAGIAFKWAEEWRKEMTGPGQDEELGEDPNREKRWLADSQPHKDWEWTRRDNSRKNVLVFGAAGYIGSVLCPMLLRYGYNVVGFDNFSKELMQSTVLASCCSNPRFELVRGDVREPRDYIPLLKTADIVINLAAVVGAPACSRDREGAEQVNHYAVNLLTHTLSPNQRLIYPNTNSGYGHMPDDTLTEKSPLNPISLYAETKLKGEVAALRHDNTVVFRLATVMGCSPRMRVDLLVNDFVLRAVRDSSIVLYEPHARRNFVHIRDVARAFIWAMETDAARGQVYNLGLDDANLTKAELCERIARHTPFRWYEGKGSDPDQRDYLVSNAKVQAAGFRFTRSLDDGIMELLKLYRGFPLTIWGNV